MRRTIRAWHAWLAVAALLALGAAAEARWGTPITGALLDWQPSRMTAQPWRAWTAVFIHYGTPHLAANLAGLLLVAALGWAARVPPRSVVAWALAWPLTQGGLWLEPELLRYGGLSGVLHAGVAVVAVHLVACGTRTQRALGAAIAMGLVAKVLSEAPWGAPLRSAPVWGMHIAPLAHATGVLAGLTCAALTEAVHRLRVPSSKPDALDRIAAGGPCQADAAGPPKTKPADR